MQGVECKQMVWERKKRVKWEFRKPEQASSFSSSNCSLYLFHKKKKKKKQERRPVGKITLTKDHSGNVGKGRILPWKGSEGRETQSRCNEKEVMLENNKHVSSNSVSGSWWALPKLQLNTTINNRGWGAES